MSEVKQTRITIKRLKVASFASEETLCYEATVLLDGLPIAQARNDGHGGMTFLKPIRGAEDKLKAAEAFAKALPPLITEHSDPQGHTHNLELPMSLEFLVDLLASHEHDDKRLRGIFRKDFTKKILFVADNQLLYLQRVKRNSCSDADLRRLHAQVRAKHGPETTILSDLGAEEAYALWKRFVLDKEKPS